ncbi:hypothetical protein [Nonomuraea soli]|uniref:DUF1349 domain-containing protein n=1 Tax=Nonomuraea soli TaxID=1032476 RepID=A0A7W0CUZ6_9ACTN|nr:hypothetical protein [Nonomuraea soli]MBA2897831.1 hypothetical protein [Nonomuraea soli]
MTFLTLYRAEWAGLRRVRGWALTLAASVLVTVVLGLLVTGGARSTCVTGEGEGACPAPLVGPDGTAVIDRYFYVHRPLTGDGSVVARVSGMTGLIRMPHPVAGVRNVVEGVVPWAKAGLLVRQSLKQGTPYAAVMLTGDHGVRMQHNYIHDVAGGPHNGAQWLRLTRAGDTVTGYESDDGRAWTKVGTAELAGLPPTVEIGLFAASPGARWDMARAFSQVTATFDQVAPQGANGSWQHDDVGVAMEADGTTPHHPGGVVESGDTLVVTGVGDIGPAVMEGGLRADLTLIGGAVGMVLVLVVGARAFGRHRSLVAGAAVVGTAAFAAGLLASGIAVPAGLALLRANENRVQPLTWATELRVIVGFAALTAAAAVLAYGLAALVRWRPAAIGLAAALVVVPYLLAGAGVAPWLLLFTPAAGFAITQSVPTFAHVEVDASLLAGYYPQPPWAGLAVTFAWAALAVGLAHRTGLERRIRELPPSGGRWTGPVPR